MTSAQDPVQEVVTELQCKIADLGNACWEVGEDILLTKRRPSLNIVYRFIDIMFLFASWPQLSACPLSGVLIKLVHKMVYLRRPLLL